MKCIVPLAGPDLFSKEFGIRPLYDNSGQSVIYSALNNRAWSKQLSGEDYIFVVREIELLSILTDYLRKNWKGCKIVTISNIADGALYSVLSALSLAPPDELIIIDLADILFNEGPENPDIYFTNQVEALLPIFKSTDKCYSYIEICNGKVSSAREKIVISDNASAGVYFFKNMQVFLKSAIHSIENRHELAFNGNLYICPMINGILSNCGDVSYFEISNYDAVGKLFK